MKVLSILTIITSIVVVLSLIDRTNAIKCYDDYGSQTTVSGCAMCGSRYTNENGVKTVTK